MRKLLLLFTTFLTLSLSASAQKIVFMPTWIAQAQFAGFYVAQELGFYDEEGIDVEIRHNSISSKITVEDHLQRGNIDIADIHFLTAMKMLAQGVKLVNILQTSQVSSLCCLADYPLKSLDDLGITAIGKWKNAYEETSSIVKNQFVPNARWIEAADPCGIFLYGAVKATLATTYNESNVIQLARGTLPEDHILRFSDYGFDCPEEGLYVTEEYYLGHKTELEKFARASKRGWDYVRENREESLDIVLKYDEAYNTRTNRMKERLMLEEILRLQINPATGVADYAPVSKETFVRLNELMITSGYANDMLDYNSMVR